MNTFLINLILILTLASFFSLGFEPKAQKLINQFEKIQQLSTENDLLDSPQSCSVDNEQISGVAEGANACNDLYSAACSLKDEKKGDLKTEKLKVQLSQQIATAREKTFQAQGTNLKDALFSHWEKLGLTPRSDLTKDELEDLLESPEEGQDFYGDSDYFREFKECSIDQDKVAEETQDYSSADLKNLPAMQIKLQEFIRKYEEKTKIYMAKDVPYFVGEFLQICDQLKDSLEEQNKELMISTSEPKVLKELPSYCKRENLYELKVAAIDLYRNSNSTDLDQQIRQFLEIHYPNFLAAKNSENQRTDEVIKEDPRELVGNLRSTIFNLCEFFGESGENILEAATRGFYEQVNKSKPTIDTLMGQTYTSERKERFEKLFASSKIEVMNLFHRDLAPRSTGESAKSSMIQNQMEKMQFFWPPIPASNLYKTEVGIQVLDESKFGLEDYIRDEITGYFFSSDLSYFTEINASYSPGITYGEIGIEERVQFNPALIVASDEEGNGLIAVMAHEVGHKIGQEVSKMNRYDLTTEYEKLVSCLKSEKSIRLQPGQEDEALADWISSQVLAGLIEKLPPAQRHQAVLDSVATYCLLGELSESIFSVKSLTESHPETSMRINGIFATPKRIREFLGCPMNDPNQKYQTCTLDGAI